MNANGERIAVERRIMANKNLEGEGSELPSVVTNALPKAWLQELSMVEIISHVNKSRTMI